MRMLIVALVAALACAACDKKEEAPAAGAGAKPEKAAEAPKEMPKTAATPAAAADPDEDLPTIADYEEEAEKDISKDSVDSEVDKLAKEIGE